MRRNRNRVITSYSHFKTALSSTDRKHGMTLLLSVTISLLVIFKRISRYFFLEPLKLQWITLPIGKMKTAYTLDHLKLCKLLACAMLMFSFALGAMIQNVSSFAMFTL